MEPQVQPGEHRISRNLWEFPEYGPTSPSPFPAKKLGAQSMMNPDFNWKHQSSLSSPCHHWNQAWSLCQTSETLREKNVQSYLLPPSSLNKCICLVPISKSSKSNWDSHRNLSFLVFLFSLTSGLIRQRSSLLLIGSEPTSVWEQLTSLYNLFFTSNTPASPAASPKQFCISSIITPKYLWKV